MQTLNIQSHQANAQYELPHFFLSSNGYDAGKPMTKPGPSCFVLIAKDAEEKTRLFWTCYCAWKMGMYIPCLVGFINPVLYIKDVVSVIETLKEKVKKKPTEFNRVIAVLNTLHQQELHLALQVKILRQLKSNKIMELLHQL